MDTDIYPPTALETRIDARSEGIGFGAFDSAVYRLGFTSIAVAGTTDPLRIGDVELVRGPGPIRTQRTLIQQRPGIDLAFDKAMEPGIEVGRGQWLTIAQLRVDDPTAVEPEVAIRTWRARARSAVGLACGGSR